jgi:hypothetical protein
VKNVDFRCFLGAKTVLNAIKERGMWGGGEGDREELEQVVSQVVDVCRGVGSE